MTNEHACRSEELSKCTHQELVQRGASWLKNKVNCGYIVTELVANTSSGEQPDVIGFRAGGVSILIECKASRSDFISDHKKPFRKRPELGMGLYRFYLCPERLIGIDELPARWGLLYMDRKNRIDRVVGGPLGNIWSGDTPQCFPERNICAEWDLMYSVLRRRDALESISRLNR